MRKTDTEPLTDGEGISAASIGTGNAGFIYERDVILALRNSGFTVSDPAGADSAKADLELTSGFKTIKFELKEKLSADFAQMNFDFDNLCFFGFCLIPDFQIPTIWGIRP